ncbi:MAG: DUF922 domain-containing Zn-dependent protease [Pseudomonadota bacterium]|nr:DUF922 domain-containing Zn-dependent protease [Pseudomonadota bacterium]
MRFALAPIALVPIALVLIALATIAAVAPSQAQTTDAFAGIPNVTFVFYDVEGRDPTAIRKAIDGARPVDPRDAGKSFDGATSWSMRWRWRGDGKGGCDLSTAAVTYAATVTLPRLTGSPTGAARMNWDRYLAALERHEAGHARYAYDHRGDVLAALTAATCATASAAAKTMITKIADHDRVYDLETQHGETQGATYP